MYELVFFFNDTATTEIYTLSLHDALPICWPAFAAEVERASGTPVGLRTAGTLVVGFDEDDVRELAALHAFQRERSEEHTSELQSRQYLVCRLLLEKKKRNHRSLLTRHLSN